MTIGGGGKYDAECEALLLAGQAQCAMVIVIGGSKGSGFSLSTVDPRLAPMIAGVMRQAADEIEADAQRFMRGKGAP